MAKPIVNGIERDLRGRAKVVRLNMISKVGQEVAGAYGVETVPATIVFDGAGGEVYRHQGIPNRKRIVEACRGGAS